MILKPDKDNGVVLGKNAYDHGILGIIKFCVRRDFSFKLISYHSKIEISSFTKKIKTKY